jgi:cyclophilin family peptidyl-prolyl cis-trans isomerase/HEAT repeat protein
MMMMDLMTAVARRTGSARRPHVEGIPRPAGRRLKFAPLLTLAIGIACAAGCAQPTERQANLRAIARWEDRRLAPRDSLATMLCSGDAHLRRAAARAAGLIGRDDILPELMAVLKDRSATVRVEAAFALGVLGNPQAIPDLQIAVAGQDRRLRQAAIEALALLPQAGEILLEPAMHGESLEAVSAWNGLRDRVADLPREKLVAAIRSGLARTENEVLWRVLRCAEKAPDSTLVPQLAPFALSLDPQVRVHACRALAQQTGGTALRAVLDSWRDETRFRDRDQARIRIAQLAALGKLAPGSLGSDDGSTILSPTALVTAALTSGARHRDPHVAATALLAMTAAVRDMPLPPQAASRESLMPVWRIRMADTAADGLNDDAASVRAAAAEAYGELRGMGAEFRLFAALPDTVPFVQAAVVRALGRHNHNPWYTLRGFASGQLPETAGPGSQPPRAIPGAATVRIAAIETAVDRYENRRRLFPFDAQMADDVRRVFVEAILQEATADTCFPVAATAAPLLGHFPSQESSTVLARAYQQAHGEGQADVRLGVLDGLQAFFAAAQDSQQAALADRLRPLAAAIVENAFDQDDVRVRQKAQETAAVASILPAELIPTPGSLRATLPAYRRSPQQPPVTLPFSAPKVRCLTRRGEFVIALDGQAAPNTCASFLALIRAGFYAGSTFHRVVPDFVVQGGDPRGDGWGGPGYSIRSEWSRLPYERGTVGIAHAGKDTGGSQFFVTLSPQPHLNARYTVFGRVERGMEIVDRIEPGDVFSLSIENE